MENDDLKSIWKTVPTPNKSDTELTAMLKERNHPVLKNIKKQALFEMAAFGIFLFCYYSMLDGAQKPFFINLVLVLAIIVNMLHHLKGYRLQKQFRASKNLNEDLKNFAVKLKSYQVETLISKVILIAGMATFFTYGIEFTQKKWGAMGLIVIIFIAQIVLLNNIWSKRIAQIKLTISEFERI